jgi:hypothetical protein
VPRRRRDRRLPGNNRLAKCHASTLVPAARSRLPLEWRPHHPIWGIQHSEGSRAHGNEGLYPANTHVYAAPGHPRWSPAARRHRLRLDPTSHPAAHAMTDHPANGLDDVVHQRVRLGILPIAHRKSNKPHHNTHPTTSRQAHPRHDARECCGGTRFRGTNRRAAPEEVARRDHDGRTRLIVHQAMEGLLGQQHGQRPARSTRRPPGWVFTTPRRLSSPPCGDRPNHRPR